MINMDANYIEESFKIQAFRVLLICIQVILVNF